MLRQTLRDAWRSVRRRRRFGLIVVLTLGAGLSGAVTLFGVAESVLLRPLPFADPSRLMWVGVELTNVGELVGPSVAVARAWASRPHGASFASIAAYQVQSSTVDAQDAPRRERVASVSGSFFATLGVRPALGRPLIAADDRPGADRVAVVSYGLWVQALGGAAHLGKIRLAIDGVPYRVVGVMPRTFAFPSEDVAAWITIGSGSLAGLEASSLHLMGAIGRLESGAAAAHATTELERLRTEARETAGSPPPSVRSSISILPLRIFMTRGVRSTIWMVLAASLLVLLVACANTASLHAGQVLARHHEMAVRQALGAERGSIAALLLTENLIYTSAGAAVALLVARLVLPVIAALGAALIPRATELRLDTADFVFAIALVLVVTAGAALAPALRAGRTDLARALRAASPGHTQTRRDVRWRERLVACQLALTVVLLAGAGLLGKSVALVLGVGPGVQTNHVMTALIMRPLGVWPNDKGPMRRFGRRLIERLEHTPGVSAAALSLDLPTSEFVPGWVHAAGAAGDDSLPVNYQVVTGHYFRTLGIPLVRGRTFGTEDGPAGVPTVILSRRLAARLYPRGSAVGREIVAPADGASGPTDTALFEVVGVVGDVTGTGPSRHVIPEVYVPYARVPVPHMTVLVRSAAPTPSIEAAIRRDVAELDPAQSLSHLGTLDSVLAESAARPRFYLILLGSFATVATLLAATGLYSVIVAAVRRRTIEIGIRMALGATRADLLKAVVRPSLVTTSCGIAFGIAGAVATTRVLRGLLVGVGAADPEVFGGVVAVLVLVAILAHIAPTRYALRVDPLVALRAE